MAETALITLENLVVCYGKFRALDGVTCSVTRGAIGLLGPNGAGKSTLIKTMLGFHRATSGSARVLGYELPRQTFEVRSRLGYMPEREVTSPKVSAVTFLTYMGRSFGMSQPDAMERAHAVLNYVGLGENRYRKMETYSTGMLQRVKLAQALIHDPELLLLDEPTNGLDPEGREEMLDLIREIAQQRRVSLMLSSHLLPDVQAVCEHVLILNKGNIVRQGSIAELTAMRESTYEVRVRESAEAFSEKLKADGCDCKQSAEGLFMVTLPPQNGSPQLLFEAARAVGTQIRHVQAARTSLAEAFLSAMQVEAPHANL